MRTNPDSTIAGIPSRTEPGVARSRVGSVTRLLLIGTQLSLPIPAAADDGDHGHGHDKWHAEFYSTLMRPDTKTSCCNLPDCRPTDLRTVGGQQQILKDGRWITLPRDKIVRVAPPDGGAHICAPPSASITWDPDFVFCVVMPPDT